jgi:hypothetical protein
VPSLAFQFSASLGDHAVKFLRITSYELFDSQTTVVLITDLLHKPVRVFADFTDFDFQNGGLSWQAVDPSTM